MRAFNMRKLILRWLFGTDNIIEYMDLLKNSIDNNEKFLCELKEHRETLNKRIEDSNNHMKSLNIMKKLIVICNNHGINVDEEIKNIN